MQDDVDVVPATTTVAAVTADTVSFTQPADHAPGDVLVFDRTAETPNGLLRKVTAVSADGRTVTTEQATLEDVIEDGTVEIGGKLMPSDLTPESRAMLADMGIVSGGLKPAAAGGLDFDWRFPSVAFERNGVAMTLAGYLQLSLDYNLTAHYEDGKLSNARLTITPRERVNLQLSFSSSVPVHIPKVGKLQWELFRPLPLTFGTIVFAAGPVPVVVQPSFQVYIGVNATGHVMFDVVQEGSVELGVKCDSGCSRTRNWSPIVDPQTQFRVNKAVIGASLRGYVRPELTLALYDVAGVYAGVEPYAQVGGEGGIIDGQFAGRAYVRAGVDGDVGVKLKTPILGWTLARLELFEFTVVEARTVWQTSGRLTFGEQQIEDQVYTVGSSIPVLTLPLATGGASPVTYQLSDLPPDLRFDPVTRTVRGGANRAGSYPMTYTATDANGVTATLRFTITVHSARPQFSVTSLPDQTYEYGKAIPTLVLPAAIGGHPPITYSLIGIPPSLRWDEDERTGLSWDPDTRTLSGTPMASGGPYRLTYRARSANGLSAVLRFNITVRRAAQPVSFGSQTIPAQSYDRGIAIPPLQLPVASGGVAPLVYSLTPTVPGLQFNPRTRTLSGTPTTAGNYPLTYTVTDANRRTASLRFNITVRRAAQPVSFGSQTIAAQSYDRGIAISPLQLPVATGGAAPLVYSLTPTVPGLQFNARTRTLSGTPTTAGSYSLTYRVTDANARSATLSFTVSVAGGVDPPTPGEPGDHGNTAANATTMNVRSLAASGRIERSDEDWFKVTVSGRGTLTVDPQEVAGADLEFWLYDSNVSTLSWTYGSDLWHASDDAGSRVYYVRVKGDDSNDVGDYALNLSFAADDYRNTAANATTMNVRSLAASGRIEKSDEDWFKVTVSGRGTLTVDPQEVAGADLEFWLYDSNVSTLSWTYGSDLWHASDDAGSRVYYVRVKGDDSNDVGDYALNLSFAADDYRNTAANATTMNVRSLAASGRIEKSDEDWFKVTVSGRGTLTVDPQEVAGADLEFWLYDSNVSTLSWTYGSDLWHASDDAGSRVYYVRVKGDDSNDVGDYALNLSFAADDYRNTAANATTMNVRSLAASGRIEKSDEDWFKVTVSGRGTLTVDPQEVAGADLEFWLYDSNVSTLSWTYGSDLWHASDDAGSRVYYVRVKGDDSNDVGDYALNLSFAADDYRNTAANATTMNVRSLAASGRIEKSDEDWFKVTVSGRGTLTVDPQEVAGADLEFWLYDSNVSTLSWTYGSDLWHASDDAGSRVYYVRVKGDDSNDVGDYVLNLSFAADG